MNSLSLLSDAQYFDEQSTKFTELRRMLDIGVPKEKLEAMKRLIAMMTIGRDVSSFFPDVVKNVIVESMEIKKLVYMFLSHYADQNQDLALLCVNSFQKDLSSHSQRTRATALRAMSSIKILNVIPLVILALRTAVKDTSPYVRKAAATAIPKVYDSDSEQKAELEELIQELLTSQEPSVLGAALFAFQEVCPERLDMIHQPYRRVCHLLADLEDEAQVVAVNILLRYARSQFLSPFAEEEAAALASAAKAGVTSSKKAAAAAASSSSSSSKAFYSDDEEDEGSASDSSSHPGKRERKASSAEYEMDPDLSLLLKQSSLLIQSANASVVQAVASLYFHVAPRSELAKVIKPLVRFVRARSAVAYCVLGTIATLAACHPDLFRPYVRDLLVWSTDPRYVRELKLEVLASIANDTNIPLLLKEFQSYVHDSDKDFVAKVITAIGRCAQAMPSIADKCLKGLLKLVSSSSPAVVAQSVVVVRQLLQINPNLPASVIKRMVALLDRVTVPSARAAIVWMIGEYLDRIPTLAPDALRLLAKAFPAEDDSVKLQTLNLSAKLFLANPKQASLLFKYVMDLAKYDMNIDLRDRARMLRALFFKKKATAAAGEDGKQPAVAEIAIPATAAGQSGASDVKELMKRSLTLHKTTPVVTSQWKEKRRYPLNSLSHLLSHMAPGYSPLPEFPTEMPDPSLRQVRSPVSEGKAMDAFGSSSLPPSSSSPVSAVASKSGKSGKSKGFYSDDEGSGSGSSSSGSDSDSSSASSSSSRSRSSSSSRSSSGSESGSGSSSEESGLESYGSDDETAKPKAKTDRKARDSDVSDSEDSDDYGRMQRSRRQASDKKRKPAEDDDAEAEDDDLEGFIQPAKKAAVPASGPAAPAPARDTAKPAAAAAPAPAAAAAAAAKPAPVASLLDLDLFAATNPTSSSSSSAASAPTKGGMAFDKLPDLLADLSFAPSAIMTPAAAAPKATSTSYPPTMPQHERALLSAAESGDAESVRQQLMFKTASLDINNCRDSGGLTPMHKAAQNGHVSVVRVLLEGGADIDVRAGNGSTPLMKAAQFNRPEMLTVLLERGADVNIKTKAGHTVKDYLIDTQAKNAMAKALIARTERNLCTLVLASRAAPKPSAFAWLGSDDEKAKSVLSRIAKFAFERK